VRTRFPQARLRIVEAYSPELREMVRSGAIDLALLSGHAPVPVNNLAVEPLFEDRLCLVGPAGDPLLRRQEIGIRHLHGLPLILTGMSSAGIRNELESLASRKRVALNTVVEVASFGLSVDMVRLGMGYTVYIANVIEPGMALAAVPITNLWLNRSMAWPMDRPLSRLGGEVLHLVRTMLHARVAGGQWPGAGPWRGAEPGA